MPVVAENESNIPISATAYGLKTVRTIAAKPRLFSESAILRFDDANDTIIIIIPARTTECAKPVTAMKAITVNVVKPVIMNLFFVNFLTKNNTNEVIITRCIPETTIKNEVPVNEKSSLTLESRAVFSPKRTARQSVE